MASSSSVPLHSIAHLLEEVEYNLLVLDEIVKKKARGISELEEELAQAKKRSFDKGRMGVLHLDEDAIINLMKLLESLVSNIKTEENENEYRDQNFFTFDITKKRPYAGIVANFATTQPWQDLGDAIVSLSQMRDVLVLTARILKQSVEDAKDCDFYHPDIKKLFHSPHFPGLLKLEHKHISVVAKSTTNPEIAALAESALYTYQQLIALYGESTSSHEDLVRDLQRSLNNGIPLKGRMGEFLRQIQSRFSPAEASATVITVAPPSPVATTHSINAEDTEDSCCAKFLRAMTCGFFCASSSPKGAAARGSYKRLSASPR